MASAFVPLTTEWRLRTARLKYGHIYIHLMHMRIQYWSPNLLVRSPRQGQLILGSQELVLNDTHKFAFGSVDNIFRPWVKILRLEIQIFRDKYSQHDIPSTKSREIQGRSIVLKAPVNIIAWTESTRQTLRVCHTCGNGSVIRWRMLTPRFRNGTWSSPM